jgi:hypothetical protein
MRISIRLNAVRWTMIALAAVLLCGCSSFRPSGPTSSSDSATANSSSSQPTSSSIQDAPARAPRPAQPGPLRTVQLYWHDIGTQKYRAAYHYLAHGSVTQPESCSRCGV